MASERCLLSVRLVDGLGVPVAHNIFLDVNTADTLSQIVGVVDDYLAVLAPIILGKGVEAVLSIILPPTGLPSTAGGEAEKTGLFNFEQDTSPYKFGVDVPTLNDAVIVDGKIDLTNTDVIAWKEWLLATHTSITPVSKYDLVLLSLIDALITFRKHRKAENRRSLEPGS